jgi:CheY-like chemotaxis protein
VAASGTRGGIEADPPGEAPSADGERRDLAGALHEVSNALTVVLGWLERAREGRESAEEVSRALDVASGRAAQARAIVRRAIGAEVEVEPAATAASVVRDAVVGLEPEAAHADVRIELSVEPAAETSLLEGASEVTQALTNLLLNAISASKPGQCVRASASRQGMAAVVFAVDDDGPGIPEARRARLLRGGGSTRRGGAGIGLRYAAQRASAAGGELRLARADGGARFELVWPATHAARAPGRSPSTDSLRAVKRRPLEGRRILIVEDDAAVVDLLDTALTARGADVVAIRDSAELDAALGSGPFHAALFDISPIHRDIQGALGAVRAHSDAVRMVVISGSAESMPQLPVDWVSAWVRKPFEIAEILAALAPP